ncbi:hypothetical protein P168DRAFT_290053 [Aspergillus campestris IBT 28561]|uniref:Uncharacterized protein n=1 Tax=Aspergillus campestris (strain IBT 28561) TaxID=1392248 RepID=A0A2I1D5Y0_ASPC2|nr:uncharacterized protein P168DRAFT_290053 [Aspergillus campestris IBT 28561]PKY05268.1 hypothetical protein P168DRAFT_290053 [Aspergillus campestris IBT 28561]
MSGSPHLSNSRRLFPWSPHAVPTASPPPQISSKLRIPTPFLIPLAGSVEAMRLFRPFYPF